MISERTLEKIIEDRTRPYAVQEWREAQAKSELPLYDYRLGHVRQVVALVKKIGPTVDADMEVLTLAAWLHDIAKPGLGGVSDHGLEGAKIASAILHNLNVSEGTIERVIDVIRKHVGLTLENPLEPVEAQVLWEADKLDKLGIAGLLHFVLNGILIKPGMDSNAIALKVRSYLPLAERIAASMSIEISKKIATERLEHLRITSEYLSNELALHQQEE
jgi:HD superfamily phosphodiesterase